MTGHAPPYPRAVPVSRQYRLLPDSPGSPGTPRWRPLLFAGLAPSTVNPLTVQVLQEQGLPTAHLQAKGVKPLIAEHFTHVITVCDRTEANCPIFPNATYCLAWALDDPAAATGSNDARIQACVAARA